MPNVQAGIWIEQMVMGSMAIINMNPNDPNAAPPPPSTSPNGITMVCRAVDLSSTLSSIDSAANNEIVYAVERELKATPEFDPKSVQTSAQVSQVDAKGTYTFTVTLTPQVPFKRN